MAAETWTRYGYIGSGGRRPRGGVEIEAIGGIGIFRGRDVLEIGAGDGRLTHAYAHAARRVVAIDIDRSALARGRAQWTREGGNVEFRSAPAQRPGVGRSRFDVVLFSWSLC